MSHSHPRDTQAERTALAQHPHARHRARACRVAAVDRAAGGRHAGAQGVAGALRACDSPPRARSRRRSSRWRRSCSAPGPRRPRAGHADRARGRARGAAAGNRDRAGGEPEQRESAGTLGRRRRLPVLGRATRLAGRRRAHRPPRWRTRSRRSSTATARAGASATRSSPAPRCQHRPAAPWSNAAACAFSLLDSGRVTVVTWRAGRAHLHPRRDAASRPARCCASPAGSAPDFARRQRPADAYLHAMIERWRGRRRLLPARKLDPAARPRSRRPSACCTGSARCASARSSR